MDGYGTFKCGKMRGRQPTRRKHKVVSLDEQHTVENNTTFSSYSDLIDFGFFLTSTEPQEPIYNQPDQFFFHEKDITDHNLITDTKCVSSTKQEIPLFNSSPPVLGVKEEENENINIDAALESVDRQFQDILTSSSTAPSLDNSPVDQTQSLDSAFSYSWEPLFTKKRTASDAGTADVSSSNKRSKSELPPVVIKDPKDPAAVRRAKNTEAARRSRAKKNERIDELEKLVDELRSQNAMLEAENKVLKKFIVK
ncbi:hypothetical protein TRICI_001669 [Trichomonascus ciferrii]|uniref:BZIP domain-containing protein n=1 Tax=Trichomonascus ciferrii TaxID=44093 RepID=A0A642V8L6_9ASCO|nr:hypothetical protein TRICI_001669 [Trichomonascus ciferrii]